MFDIRLNMFCLWICLCGGLLSFFNSLQMLNIEYYVLFDYTKYMQ